MQSFLPHVDIAFSHKWCVPCEPSSLIYENVKHQCPETGGYSLSDFILDTFQSSHSCYQHRQDLQNALEQHLVRASHPICVGLTT